MATGYTRVYVNDVLVTDYVINGSINISDEINSKVNTCTLNMYKEDTWKPEYGNTIEIYDHDDNNIFGGIITKITEKGGSIRPGTTSEILKYSVSCSDYTYLFQRKLIIETYENMTCKQIIDAMLLKYFGVDNFVTTSVETGPVVTQISFNYKSADKAIDDLAKAVGYSWYVGYDKDIHFFDTSVLSSVMTFNQTDTNWTNLTLEPDVTQLRNRVYVRGGIYYSDAYTQLMVADGEQKDFTLAYTPAYDGFGVVISSVSRTVGLDNIDEADYYDFMLDRKEKALKMGNSTWAQANTPLAYGTVLNITYNYEIPILIVQEDTNSIETMKALNGGDGIYEYVIVDKNITSISAARERASAELTDYSNPITKGSIESYEASTLKSGQIIHITNTDRGIDTDYLVQSVKIKQINYNTYRYTINFAGKLYGLVDVLISLFKRSQEIIIGKDEVLDAFNRYTDFTDGSYDATPVFTVSAPPFKWSNDAGSTTNKMRWNLFEWN